MPVISGIIVNPHAIREIMKYANPVKPSWILNPAHIKDKTFIKGHTTIQQRNEY